MTWKFVFADTERPIHEIITILSASIVPSRGDSASFYRVSLLATDEQSICVSFPCDSIHPQSTMDNGPGISPPFAILKVNDH